MLSAGISTSAYSSSSLSLGAGNILSAPMSVWSTTSPALTRSDNITPTILAIIPALLLELRHAVEAVERGHFITFREGWIVEDRIDEVVQRSAESHDGLPDVQQLAGALADDVHAEQRVRLAMEDELEAAGGVAADLPARDLAVVGYADFVRHIFLGELFFGLADEADLRNGVDAVGIKAGVGEDGFVTEGAGGGDAALLHGDGCERREPDHISGRENIRNLGAEVLVDWNAAALVGLKADGGEVQLVHIALAAYGIEQRVASDLLLAFEIGDDGAVGQLF